MKSIPDPVSRRHFIRQAACAGLGYAAVVNSLSHLILVNGALAQTTLPGYKALVVLFLGGGNDSNNMLIPQMGHPEYGRYKSGRGILTIYDPNDPARGSSPASITLNTLNGTSYGVHPQMQPVADLFNTGELAFVANVGTLAYPILTRDQYIQGIVPPPPRLFSHEDQVLQWQSSVADTRFMTGWGGRVADLLNPSASSAGSVSMSVSLAGINKLQVGNHVAQYAVSPTGAIPLGGYGPNYSLAKNADGSYKTTTQGKRLKAFDDIMRYTHDNLLEEGYDSAIRKSRASEALIGTALTAAATSGVNFDTIFGSGTDGLSGQMKMIAKLIAGRNALGNSRQIFFCQLGGYDTHSAQLEAHANLMDELASSLGAFHQSMVALGVNEQVMTMTHSDFTRTLIPNGTDVVSAGSDHGWGGHHIVMGGPIHGQRIYGYFPSLDIGVNQDEAGHGRWIPTTSVDQYTAVAAKWLGVDNSALPAIFPNLGRFPDPFGTAANLGFIG